MTDYSKRICSSCKLEIPKGKPSWMDKFGQYSCRSCLDRQGGAAETLEWQNQRLREKNKEYLEVMASQAKEIEKLSEFESEATYLLKKLEWASEKGPSGETWDGCFFCSGTPDWSRKERDGPHAEGCRLGKLLGRKIDGNLRIVDWMNE